MLTREIVENFYDEQAETYEGLPVLIYFGKELKKLKPDLFGHLLDYQLFAVGEHGELMLLSSAELV